MQNPSYHNDTPAMTTTQRDALVSPPAKMRIYNLTTLRYEYYNGTSWMTMVGNDSKIQKASTGVFETAVIDTEYISPNQHGGIYGTVYRQYFGTSLPASLTAGNNVTRMIAWQFYTDNTASRYVFIGNSSVENGGTEFAHIELTGTSGAGNLVLTLTITSHTLISGWVDYAK